MPTFPTIFRLLAPTIEVMGNSSNTGRWIPKIHTPKNAFGGSCIAVRVEGIDHIVHRRNEQNIMGAHSRNRQVRHVQGLSIDGAIDRIRVDEAKLVYVYVRRVQRGFVEIRACPPEVVMFSGNRYLGRTTPAMLVRNRKASESLAACLIDPHNSAT